MESPQGFCQARQPHWVVWSLPLGQTVGAYHTYKVDVGGPESCRRFRYVGVVISSLVCFVGGHGGMYHKDIRTLDLHFRMSIHRGSLLHMDWALEWSDFLDVWMNEQHQSWCGICCGSYGQLAAQMGQTSPSSLDSQSQSQSLPGRRQPL